MSNLVSVSPRSSASPSLNLTPDTEERNAIRLFSAEFKNITSFIQQQLTPIPQVNAVPNRMDDDVDMNDPERIQDDATYEV